MIPMPDTVQTMQLGMIFIATLYGGFFQKRRTRATDKIICSMWLIGSIIYGAVAK